MACRVGARTSPMCEARCLIVPHPAPWNPPPSHHHHPPPAHLQATRNVSSQSTRGGSTLGRRAHADLKEEGTAGLSSRREARVNERAMLFI